MMMHVYVHLVTLYKKKYMTIAGVMRCGPAPLKAVKEGHVYLNYDVGFVFAEVNGDRVKWMVHDFFNIKWKLI